MIILPVIWGAPENWIYFSVWLVASGFLIYRLITWRRSVRMLAQSSQFNRLVRHASFTKQITKTALMIIGLLFLCIALLRPQWNKKEVTVAQEGRDVFVALDISRSMLAQDCSPNRLACAKQKIKDLLKFLSCERVGLILFSGSTFVQCPLTADFASFNLFLNQIDVETISSGSTALDLAIKQALEAFKASGERKNKLLVIFTDGEDFSSNLSTIKQEAAREHMTIFTVGVGTQQGAPIPLSDDQCSKKGHQLDKRGNVVISRLNEGILQSLAADCGGSYITMTHDDSDIKSLVKKLQRFDKEKIDERKISHYQEQYPYFVAVSFICFALEWLL